MISMAKAMTLSQMAGFAQANIDQGKLAAIVADLASVKPSAPRGRRSLDAGSSEMHRAGRMDARGRRH